MVQSGNYRLVLLALCMVLTGADAVRTSILHLSMPNIRPEYKDTYICSAQSVDLTRTEYVVGYQPTVESGRLHHIGVFGCEELPYENAGDLQATWECSSQTKRPGVKTGSICKEGTSVKIIYMWALDAPGFRLPDGVGLKIGGNTFNFKHIVLQAHYADITPFEKDPHLRDDSGVLLYTVAAGLDSGITKQAGILVLASGGYVEEGDTEHTVDCPIRETMAIHPFRIRTHSHGLGYNIGLIFLPHGDRNKAQIVAQHDPQRPQTFYQIEDTSLTLTRGDKLISFCQYNNTRGHPVEVGESYDKEMCAVYIFYWVAGDKLMEHSFCGSMNPR